MKTCLLLTILLPTSLFAELGSYPLRLNNGLGLTPQMGWNSWNHYHCNINQDIMMSTMQTLVSSGLAKAGYIYTNIDDCWAGSRSANGTIIPDSKTFSNGITPLTSYAHSVGLKFGLYSDAGSKTCAGRPGSLGYETNDANTYAQWGVDYLKYDNCNAGSTPMQQRYNTMRDALNATGRAIFFSMCSWGGDNVDYWGNNTGNSWRTTGDIGDKWSSMLSNWDHNGPSASASPGGWNDPDMLEVGNGGMTTTEYITHFSLWCIGKAPLLIGCDITKMSTDTQMILMNEEAIAINQDKYGIQATRKTNTNGGNYQVYSTPLSNNQVAVLFLNRASSSGTIEVTWQELGLQSTQTYVIRDLWKKQNVATRSGNYSTSVASHGVAFFKFTPSN